jgi:hypothetical protein
MVFRFVLYALGKAEEAYVFRLVSMVGAIVLWMVLRRLYMESFSSGN